MERIHAMSIKTHIHQETYQAPCTLFLDQASTVGWSLWDNTNTIIQSGILERKGDTLEDHGAKLVEFIHTMVSNFNVTTVLYEEVFIPRDGNPGNVAGVEKLYYIKHKITDLRYTSSLQVFGLDNGTWKKFLRNGSKKKAGMSDKDEILHYVKQTYPDLEPFTEDESDAVGMGIAVMINNEGRFYDVSRFNKKLPMHWGVSSLNFDALDPNNKLLARFHQAREAGGIYEISLNKSRKVDDEFKKLLTHQDVLAFCVIPKSYMNWGIYLLEHNIDIEDLREPVTVDYLAKNGLTLKEQEPESYIIYASRKKRL